LDKNYQRRRGASCIRTDTGEFHFRNRKRDHDHDCNRSDAEDRQDHILQRVELLGLARENIFHPGENGQPMVKFEAHVGFEKRRGLPDDVWEKCRV
jgi:hypothetical protein